MNQKKKSLKSRKAKKARHQKTAHAHRKQQADHRIGLSWLNGGGFVRSRTSTVLPKTNYRAQYEKLLWDSASMGTYEKYPAKPNPRHMVDDT